MELAIVPAKLAELANTLGASPIKDQVWTHQIDDAWRVSVNGHDHARAIDGLHVEPYHFVIWYHGWPAGVMNPFDGVMAAGSAANEDALIEALEAAIGAAQK